MKNLPYIISGIAVVLILWISWTLSYQINLPRMDENYFQCSNSYSLPN